MKRRTNTQGLRIAVLTVLCLMLMGTGTCASAQRYSTLAAKAWVGQFASALSQLDMLNDPLQTADPARAGEYLLEYSFGTVHARSVDNLMGEDILGVDIRTAQVTDSRGLRVGMSEDAALNGVRVGASSTQLYVLDVDESGWSWAYIGDNGVYGVEYIAYDFADAFAKEYTLTYIIDNGVISAIRMKIAEATQAQAMDGTETAREIASRQHGEVLVMANSQTIFTQADAQVMGRQALGTEVAEFVGYMGEPDQIQTLPGSGGRILVYDGAAVTLGLDEYTGVEIVRGVSVSREHGIQGPRGLSVGLSVQEAAALFRCAQDVSTLGGVLYLEGEAYGEAPCGLLSASGMGDVTLSYSCLTAQNEEIVLEIGARDNAVTYWQLHYKDDIQGGV